MNTNTLSVRALRQALNLRDLTDPDDGPHAMQILIQDMLRALQEAWQCKIKLHRESPIVSIEDNYEKLRYPPDGAARDTRYSRYVTASTLLRTMASAMVPGAMRSIAHQVPDDVLLACPGIVYRRDCIDRLHTGEPHQLDLWRLCRTRRMDESELRHMIRIVVETALPGMQWRTEPRVHPYTLTGLQIDVEQEGEWVEIGECGIAHPEIIAENIPGVEPLGGLALGLGLDRLLMLRKHIKDIRLLRSTDARITAQMQDLAPYREVSCMPAVLRDISLVIDKHANLEDMGHKVREALLAEADVVEHVEIISQTPYEALPAAAMARLGISPGQKNVLLRIVLRALDRTLTSEACNLYRDAIYAKLHQGTVWQWAAKT